MNRISTYRLAVAVTLLTVCNLAAAAAHYVSDDLSVNLRRGPGTGYRIKRMVDAGTEVKKLSSTKGWTKVRTEKGNTGYILSSQLSDKPAAADQVSHYKKENRKLRKKYDSLHSSSGKNRDRIDALKKENTSLKKKNKKINQKFEKLRETSADAIHISRQNKKYHQQLMSLKSRAERLKHKNQALESRREGMKIGALILFVGIVLGLLLSLLRKRRSNSWGSL